MIHIIRKRASEREMAEMLQMLRTYIKLAVDVRREILAGGGAMHADCEAALLNDGSRQEDVWGADWNPFTQEVTYESLINIRPRQNNRSMELQSPVLRAQVEQVVVTWLGGVDVGKLA
jgi:hypothetical protein